VQTELTERGSQLLEALSQWVLSLWASAFNEAQFAQVFANGIAEADPDFEDRWVYKEASSASRLGPKQLLEMLLLARCVCC